VRGSPDPALVLTAGLCASWVHVVRAGDRAGRTQWLGPETGHNNEEIGHSSEEIGRNDGDAGGLVLVRYHAASHAEVSEGEV
jgi:hypothetical protein